MTISKLSSHRKESDKIFSSTVTVPVVNFATSIYAAFALFAFVGYASKSTGVPIEDMKMKGMELTFVVYPALLNTLPFPNFWAVSFFIMMT